MPRAACCALLAALASLALASVASAQDLPVPEDSEAHARIFFVPRLAGAVSVDASVMAPFDLGVSSGYPSTWGLSAGWRQNFEGHGRLALRTSLTYERGGLLGAVVEGRSNRFGLMLSPSVRGISDEWVFASLALLLDASYIRLTPPISPFGGPDESTRDGWQAGVGIETTFGALFVLDPFLFAESGASATLSHVSVGDVEAWEVWARWVLRFDWAVRGSSTSHSSPTVSRP